MDSRAYFRKVYVVIMILMILWTKLSLLIEDHVLKDRPDNLKIVAVVVGKGIKEFRFYLRTIDNAMESDLHSGLSINGITTRKYCSFFLKKEDIFE